MIVTSDANMWNSGHAWLAWISTVEVGITVPPITLETGGPVSLARDRTATQS